MILPLGMISGDPKAHTTGFTLSLEIGRMALIDISISSLSLKDFSSDSGDL